MGCDGCELWNEILHSCYAGRLTERFAGQPGWSDRFDKPKVFLERIDRAIRWPDLTGTTWEAHKKIPAKPWLDGYPRTICFNDMGDTFTESLPVDWFDSCV